MPLEAEVAREPAPSCCRPACCSTSPARCPADELDAGAAHRRAGRRAASAAPRRSTCARCAPRTSRRSPTPGRRDARRRSPARRSCDTITTRRPLGLARRDAPGAHRHPHVRLRAGAAHGRDRLLPAERQGDRARDRAARAAFEANVPARALQELARIAQQATATTRSPSASGRTRSSSSSATSSLLAPDRRPVPQLPPAAAGVGRARAARWRARELDRRRAPHQPAGAEERAAAAELQRGHADGLGADARTSARRSEAIPVPFHGEPFEIGFNPEFLRDGLESVELRRARAEADQPAAPRPDRIARRRRLRLPDHAHPPERVGPMRVVRVRCATSAPTPRARGAARRGPDGGPRAERRRQVEPARGALLRLHRPLAAHAQRARAGPLRRRRRARRACDAEAERRRARAERRLRSPGASREAHDRRRRAGRAPARRRRAGRSSASSCPTAWSW